MSELVRYERSDAVSTITMDDGKMNVMSAGMLRALNAALDRAQTDKTVVLLTGRENVWSAGFDLAVFKQGKTARIEMLKAGAETAERLLSFPAPVVAACTALHNFTCRTNSAYRRLRDCFPQRRSSGVECR